VNTPIGSLRSRSSNAVKTKTCLWWYLLFSAFALNGVFHACQTSYAGESSADPDKLAIIQLIEDQLAAAYTVRSEKEAPDFGTLDRIYPKWHNGEPANARRTFSGYRTYTVSYTVHSVWVDRPGMATVKGKKHVFSARRKKFLKILRRTKRATSDTQFTITCRRSQEGLWKIMKELEYQ